MTPVRMTPVRGCKPVVAVLEGDNDAFDVDGLARHAEVRTVDARGLRDALEGAHALLMWDFFSSAVHDALAGGVPDTLDWIHVAASGVDALLTPEIVASPVQVTRAVGVFERPIAEYVLACVAAHAKELWLTRAHQERRRWAQRTTTDLRGKRAVVLGAGGIGGETGRLLRAVGLEVAVVGRRARAGADGPPVRALADVGTLLPTADILVLALPLTPETEGIVDARMLGLLPSTAYVVNVGRGRTLDQDALADLVSRRRLAGAAIDTFATEPLPQASPLWNDPRVFVSPHMSSRTDSWRAALAAQFVEQFRLWASGRPLTALVDKERGY